MIKIKIKMDIKILSINVNRIMNIKLNNLKISMMDNNN